MKKGQNGVVSIITVIALVVLGVGTLVSSILVSNRKKPQSLSTKAAEPPSHPASCNGVSVPDSFDPSNYYWDADCESTKYLLAGAPAPNCQSEDSANPNKYCKQSDDSKVYPPSSNWCYQFGDGFTRCMMLKYFGTGGNPPGTVPPAQPTQRSGPPPANPTPVNSCSTEGITYTDSTSATRSLSGKVDFVGAPYTNYTVYSKEVSEIEDCSSDDGYSAIVTGQSPDVGLTRFKNWQKTGVDKDKYYCLKADMKNIAGNEKITADEKYAICNNEKNAEGINFTLSSDKVTARIKIHIDNSFIIADGKKVFASYGTSSNGVGLGNGKEADYIEDKEYESTFAVSSGNWYYFKAIIATNAAANGNGDVLQCLINKREGFSDQDTEKIIDITVSNDSCGIIPASPTTIPESTSTMVTFTGNITCSGSCPDDFTSNYAVNLTLDGAEKGAKQILGSKPQYSYNFTIPDIEKTRHDCIMSIKKNGYDKTYVYYPTVCDFTSSPSINIDLSVDFQPPAPIEKTINLKFSGSIDEFARHYFYWPGGNTRPACTKAGTFEFYFIYNDGTSDKMVKFFNFDLSDVDPGTSGDTSYTSYKDKLVALGILSKQASIKCTTNLQITGYYVSINWLRSNCKPACSAENETTILPVSIPVECKESLPIPVDRTPWSHDYRCN